MEEVDVSIDTQHMVNPLEDLAQNPKTYRKTHCRRKFTRTIFDTCPKDIQHMLFNYCVNAMLTDPMMLEIKQRWKDSFRYGKVRRHVEHYISFSHRLLRALAQTCRSLHIKVSEYRRMIQMQLLIRQPGRKNEFLRIEKERTKQNTRHTKTVKITKKKNKAYWVKKNELKKRSQKHQKKHSNIL